jgi:hypothetical protein
MAEGDGTATVCVALLTRAFWTNMQKTLAIAASSPVMRPTSIESRNTDLTGIVLNSYALGAFMRFRSYSVQDIMRSSAFTLHGRRGRGSSLYLHAPDAAAGAARTRF